MRSDLIWAKTDPAPESMRVRWRSGGRAAIIIRIQTRETRKQLSRGVR